MFEKQTVDGWPFLRKTLKHFCIFFLTETGLELMRPFLHEFLSSAYEVIKSSNYAIKTVYVKDLTPFEVFFQNFVVFLKLKLVLMLPFG
jgi:hypothetical protein